jgi:hypothetical protein
LKPSGLKQANAVLVVADLPALGIAAAHAAARARHRVRQLHVGLDLLGIRDSQDVVDSIGRIYATRPVHSGCRCGAAFATMPRIEDVPFVARRSRRDAREVASPSASIRRHDSPGLLWRPRHGTDRPAGVGPVARIHRRDSGPFELRT